MTKLPDDVEQLCWDQLHDLKRHNHIMRELFGLNRRIEARKKQMLALLLEEAKRGEPK